MPQQTEWFVSAGVAVISLAAIIDTGVHGLTETALTAWSGLALLLLIGVTPAMTVPTGAGRSDDLLLICHLVVGGVCPPSAGPLIQAAASSAWATGDV